MSEGHTKGTWDLGDSDITMYHVFADSTKVASCDFLNLPPKEMLANARLIAAAPRLLEACEAIANLSQHGDIMASLYGSGALVAQCQRAVDKAKK